MLWFGKSGRSIWGEQYMRAKSRQRVCPSGLPVLDSRLALIQRFEGVELWPRCLPAPLLRAGLRLMISIKLQIRSMVTAFFIFTVISTAGSSTVARH